MNTRGQMISGMHEKPTGLVKCSQSTDHAGKTTYQVWTESSWTPTGLCWETHYVKGGQTFLLQKPKVKPPEKQPGLTHSPSPHQISLERERTKNLDTPLVFRNQNNLTVRQTGCACPCPWELIVA